jgi:hypothetical protein
MRRRRWLLIVAVTASALALTFTGPATASPARTVPSAHRHSAAGPTDPVPIPGGIQIPDGPFIHTFAPGPEDLGFQGIHVEPNTITNFDGFSAMAYVGGTATDADGNTYDMFNDMRVFSGTYIAEDGSTQHGTFAFI